MKAMKLSTLCFLLKDDQILLAMKKRGFGEGKWNGVGGKVEEGESVEHAALREMEEEIGTTADEADLEPVGMLRFRSLSNEKLNWDVRVFFLRAWRGEPRESEEMRPQWYPINQLPFESMWPDDKHWFPHLLAGEKIAADFEFNTAGDDFVDFSIKAL
jgi:8-oxo-dGTP pyrophosphatase MutT (NUDIX family)